MAQWLGQFSGHTHATKVEDAEDSLRHAVAALRSTGPGEDREKKAKAVGRLAKRLMTVRLKSARARIAAAKDVSSGVALEKRAKEIESLVRKEAALGEGGIASILREFGVRDVSVG